jgi:hypothetical protein
VGKGVVKNLRAGTACVEGSPGEAGSVLPLGAKLAELWPAIVAADASQWNRIDALVRAEMKRLIDSRE